MDGPSWVRGAANLAALLLYFVPTFVGWRRSRGASPGPAVPVGLLFVLNLLLGWTFFGWIAVLFLAFREPHQFVWGRGCGEPVAWQSDPATAAAAAVPATAPPYGWEASPLPATEPCPRCGGRGETCPRCQGMRGAFELPTGESGTSTWVPCTYCVGSGRVQCGQCGAVG